VQGVGAGQGLALAARAAEPLLELARGPAGEGHGQDLPCGHAAVEQGQVVVRRPDDVAANRALHGLSRALIANMVRGCAEGYSRSLEIYGTGYSANVDGKNLLLNCGYMGRGVGRKAQFMIPIPEGLQIRIETPAARGNNEPARFTVTGPDKQQVNQFAAEIRKLRKPEPYLGKGIRYAGEQIRRKAGKVFAGGGG